jgi:hypothetical protein
VAGGGEQAHGLFVRVYETVAMHLHERAASSLMCAQAILDTATGSKRAAAAASAGGGVAVEGALHGAPAKREAIVRQADARAPTAFVKQPSPQQPTPQTLERCSAFASP